MEFTIIERASDAFQQSVARDDIVLLCQRAFGENCQPTSVKELPGCFYNNTYLIRIESLPPLVLRISPTKARQLKGELNLMRNEHAFIPFFAPIAPLLPRTIMADFTHQLINRDYIFQSFIEGEQWSQIKNELTPEESKTLWHQLGSITKKIHGVKGKTFGNPFNGSSFSLWSDTIVDWFSSLISNLEDVQLVTMDLKSVLRIVKTHRQILDEITQPSLLHGDLWLMNILVNRVTGEPQITGIIDNDRASWGDPLADWTIFILERNSDPEEASFWETYGFPEKTREVQFRELIYRGFYTGAIRLEQFRLHHNKAVKRTYEELEAVIEALETFNIIR